MRVSLVPERRGRPVRRSAALAVAVGLCLLAGRAPAAGIDPWEPMNRGLFWFNERVDMYALEPVTRGWIFSPFSDATLCLSNWQ